MKMIIAALALVAVAAAAVLPEDDTILRSDFNQQADGGYEFVYETKGGINRQESGVLKEAVDEENKPHQVVVVRGSYSYTDPEGKVETINYEADENGYRADGPSVPKVASRR